MKQESSAPTGQTTRSDGSARPTPWAPVAPPATSAPAPSGARRQFPRWAVLTPVALLAGAGLGQWLTPLVGQVSGSQVWGGAAVGAVVATLVALGLPWLARALAPKASAAVAPPPAAQVVPAAQRLVRDPLTGAYTQHYFVAAADREWARLRRHGEDAALLMVDIDRFKRLNETHGQAFADAMLVEVTRLASATLRPYDLLARFGGGVLVIYLPHTDPMGALDVAERIRDRVAGLRLTQDGKTTGTTVSVGVAPIGEGHPALDAVITDAGEALREAKASGRNCVRSAPIPPRHSPQPGAPMGDRRRAGPV